nr:MAG TPA: terminase small subunit [Caudoviricetes sp.]
MATKFEIDLAKVEQYAQWCDSEEEIARALGISYSTLRRRKKQCEQFEQAIKKGKAKANVFVGGKLMEHIKAGNIAATIFYLKSRCGWKETSRQEMTGADGAPIQVEASEELTERQKAIVDKVLDEEF